ncbi:hypothetical protein CVT26_003812 [Gymnopilus dilepis]|uniref:Uncharacterized protein n=1 Tax=Gymnopilus dilepis TaxID=231916 RepID=A0A409YMB7_9AGAR|nr:hypothetical protein CVT26_003812 [Gymnopilus dilepis]
MLKGGPLFPPCDDERLYVKAKTHVFVAVLGDFSSDMILRIQIAHRGIFTDRSQCELADPGDLPNNVRDFLERAESLRDAICDKATFDVMDYLLKISPDDRVGLDDVLDFSYFDAVD